ncbi:BON domain-containing protein [Novipirellula rosea]|uniref:BON domain-containing protein n=1 Tax=Novipirellula rosea TaxID=1031540 RepID=UPI0031E9E174
MRKCDATYAGLPSDGAEERSSPKLTELPVIQPCGCPLVAGVQGRWARSGYAALRNISCRCDDGDVVIDGTVPSYFFKQMARELARSVNGVHRIKNRLMVDDEGGNKQQYDERPNQ